MSEPSPIGKQGPLPDQSRWFADEVQPYGSALRSYVRGAFPAVRDLDDVVQESYLRALKEHAARPIRSVKAFLFAVARNLALDSLRHQRASPIRSVTTFAVANVMADGPSGDEVAAMRQEYGLALEAIDRLPPRCREVVILRKLQGLSPPETAKKLGISEETVHVQSRRGLRRVQAFLLERGVTDRGHR